MSEKRAIEKSGSAADPQALSEAFVDRLVNRQTGAYEELVEQYGSRCYGYFYRLCGDPETSEELVSELLVRLVEKVSTFESGSFDKWLFTIASNLFRDHLRRKYRYKRLLEDSAKEQRLSDDLSDTRSGEVFDKLQKAMGKLDTETAELLMLRYYSQTSFKELADIRKEPVGTTLSKVHRGLKKLKLLMENMR
jgi:RNA polymerase sigma-70 factor, ECF subfamily